MVFSPEALKTARESGYSDEEIYGHLATVDPRFSKAKEAGYGLDDVAAHFAQTATSAASQAAPASTSAAEVPQSVAQPLSAGDATAQSETAGGPPVSGSVIEAPPAESLPEPPRRRAGLQIPQSVVESERGKPQPEPLAYEPPPQQGAPGVIEGAGLAGMRAYQGAARMVGASKEAEETGKAIAGYEEQFPATGTAKRIGRGVGGAASLLAAPGGIWGMLGMTGAQSVGGGYEQGFAEAKAAGKTDEEAAEKARMKAFTTTLRSVPELAAYWLVGMGAAKAIAPVVKQAGAVKTAIATGAAATAANVATSSTMRVVHGEPAFTPEGLATDATFGFFAHGVREGASRAANVESIREALKSSPTEALKASAADPEFRKSAPYDPRLIDAEIARRDAGGKEEAPPPPKAPVETPEQTAQRQQSERDEAQALAAYNEAIAAADNLTKIAAQSQDVLPATSQTAQATAQAIKAEADAKFQRFAAAQKAKAAAAAAEPKTEAPATEPPAPAAETPTAAETPSRPTPEPKAPIAQAESGGITPSPQSPASGAQNVSHVFAGEVIHLQNWVDANGKTRPAADLNGGDTVAINVKNGERQLQLDVDNPTEHVADMPDGKVVWKAEDETYFVFDPKTASLKQQIEDPTQSVNALFDAQAKTQTQAQPEPAQVDSTPAVKAGSVVGGGVEPFSPDDTLIMHSPYTGEDVEVSYRGPLGDKSVVWTGKSQMAIPTEWLRRVGEERVGSTNEPKVPSKEEIPIISRTDPLPPPLIPTTKTGLIEELIGKRPEGRGTADYEVQKRVQWDKDAKEYGKRTKADLEGIVQDVRAQKLRGQIIAEYTTPLFAELKPIAEAAGTNWRGALAEEGQKRGFPDWKTLQNNTRGDEIYRLASRIAERESKGGTIRRTEPVAAPGPQSVPPSAATGAAAKTESGQIGSEPVVRESGAPVEESGETSKPASQSSRVQSFEKKLTDESIAKIDLSDERIAFLRERPEMLDTYAQNIFNDVASDNINASFGIEAKELSAVQDRAVERVAGEIRDQLKAKADAEEAARVKRSNEIKNEVAEQKARQAKEESEAARQRKENAEYRERSTWLKAHAVPKTKLQFNSLSGKEIPVSVYSDPKSWTGKLGYSYEVDIAATLAKAERERTWIPSSVKELLREHDTEEVMATPVTAESVIARSTGIRGELQDELARRQAKGEPAIYIDHQLITPKGKYDMGEDGKLKKVQDLSKTGFERNLMSIEGAKESDDWFGMNALAKARQSELIAEREAANAAETKKRIDKQEAENARIHRANEYRAAVEAVELPKGKKQTIKTTAVDKDGKTVKVPKEATVYGDFAITKTVPFGRGKPSYVVTHIPSGMSMLSERTESTLGQAKSFIQAIIHSGADLSKKEPPKAELEKAGAAARFMREGGEPPESFVLPTPAAEASPDYAAIADTLKAMPGTLPKTPAVEVSAEARQRIVDAYKAEVAKTGMEAVRIADVLEKAGYTPETMAEGKGALAQMRLDGDADFAIGDTGNAGEGAAPEGPSGDRARAWGIVPTKGDSPHMLMKLREVEEPPAVETKPPTEPLNAFEKALQDERRAYRKEVSERPVEQQPPRMWYDMEAAKRGIGPNELTYKEIAAYKQMWKNAVDAAIRQKKPVYISEGTEPPKGWVKKKDLWYPPAGEGPIVRVRPDPFAQESKISPEPKISPEANPPSLSPAAREKALVDAYSHAERIADEITRGQPDSVREAAFNAAYDNTRQSVEKTGSFNPNFMRLSAKTAAKETADRLGTSLDEPIGEGETTAKDQLPAPEPKPDVSEEISAMNSAIYKALSPRDAAIVRAAQERTLEDVGSEHGISKQAVSEIVKKSLKKIRAQMERDGYFPEDYVGGGGPMGPIESLEMKMLAEEGRIGAYNAKVDEQRAERGLPPLMSAAREANPVTWDAAIERIEANPESPANLVESILSGDKKSVSRDEQAELLWRLTDLRNKLELESERAVDENATPQERADAQATAEGIELQLQRTEEADRKAGTAQGAALQFRQVLANQDYTFGGLMRRVRKATGEPVGAEKRAEIAAMAKRIAELEGEVAAARSAETDAQVDAEVSRTYEATINTLGKEFLKQPTFGREVLDIAHGIVNRWKLEADEARESLKGFFGSESGSIGGPGGGGRKLGEGNKASPQIISAVAKIIRAKIGEFGLKRAEVTAELISEFGNKVKPLIGTAWEKAQQMIQAEEAPPKVKSAVRTGLKKKGQETPVDVAARAKANAVAGEELSHQLVYDLARAHYRAGVRGEGPLMAAVHADLREAYPDLTERDVRRAYAEYGKVTFPSKEEDLTALRELRTLVKLQEDIDRMTDGLDALHQGYQRDKATLLIREKTKLRNDLLRKRQGPASPESLARGDEARKTALRNQIELLDNQLRTGEKPVKGTPAPLSAEAERLTSERDAMRAKLEEIEALENPGPTPEQKAEAAAIRAAEKSIAELDARIKAQEYATPKVNGRTPLTAKLEALHAERDAMRDYLNEQRKAAQAKPVGNERQAQIDALSEIRDRLNEKLSNPKPPDAPKDWTPLSTEAENIQSEILAMQELAAQIRRESKAGDPQAKAEERKLKSLDASIERYRKKTEDAFKPANGKPFGPETRRVASAKEVLKSRREMYQFAKSFDIYNDRRLRDVQRRTMEVQQRIAKGDYAAKAKPVPKAKNAAVMKAETEYEREKVKFLTAQKKAELAKRTRMEKGLDALTKWRRAFILSGPVTLAKLTSAAIQRLVFTPFEEGVGAVYSKIFPSLAERAPREGGISPRAEARAIAAGFTQGMKDSWDILRTGKSDLDVRFHGEHVDLPAEAIDFIGHIHGALKAQAKRAEFTRSFEKRTEAALRAGVDVRDPMVQTSIGLAAYKDASRAIFMQDNRVVSAYKRALTAFSQKNAAGEVPPSGRAATFAAKILLPIVKVPTNIVAETIQTATGLVTGSVRLANAYRKGIENLPQEHADLIMRELKKGSLGAAVLLLGFLNPEAIGGYYQPGEKRKDKDVKAGRIKVYGVEIPSYLLHNPLLEMLQLGSTVRRVADSKMKKSDGSPQGIPAGLMAGAVGIIEEVPFVQEMTHLGELLDPHERERFLGELAKSLVIPQAIDWLARYMDQDPKGETRKRKPHGVVETMKTGIPLYRQEVPEKKR